MTHSKPMALISVTDKSGIVPFAQSLTEHGYHILSTGGSAKVLREGGVEVEDVASYTKSPEILNGRVKTLHPLVHGGILFDRDNTSHKDEISKHGILPIDLVIVNLYEFKENAANENLSLDKAIEYIDIGGPTMLRAAAKNYLHTAPVIDPSDYGRIIKDLETHSQISSPLRTELAAKTFKTISAYDNMIASYFESQLAQDQEKTDHTANKLGLRRVQSLRYGENPHQKAGFYTDDNNESGLQDATVLQGKELSYNNILDIDAATAIVRDFSDQNAVAIIKHTNPCGVSAEKGKDIVDLFSSALKCDPKSAFGGIVAVNDTIDARSAQAMTEIFLECIAAPSFTDEALEVFSKKKNLRILKVPFLKNPKAEKQDRIRSVQGGFLIQGPDNERPDSSSNTWKVATTKAPTSQGEKDLVFAQIIAKHVKSNAIVFAKNETTVAVGAGQMSRVDAAMFAIGKATEMGQSIKGSVMASDAFFPFRDTVDLAAKHGVEGIIQPGGSIRDEESIQSANDHGISMVFTGIRHFKH